MHSVNERLSVELGGIENLSLLPQHRDLIQDSAISYEMAVARVSSSIEDPAELRVIALALTSERVGGAL